jgi:hypothetical protein|tara:strand:+ start:456 stop:644 length:189 start_codon:yes stop_codon:yes gene_type:complete
MITYNALSNRELNILQKLDSNIRYGIEKALLQMDPYTRFTAIESLANKGRWNQPKAYHSTYA